MNTPPTRTCHKSRTSSVACVRSDVEILEGHRGFEPLTAGFEDQNSSTELMTHIGFWVPNYPPGGTHWIVSYSQVHTDFNHTIVSSQLTPHVTRLAGTQSYRLTQNLVLYDRLELPSTDYKTVILPRELIEQNWHRRRESDPPHLDRQSSITPRWTLRYKTGSASRDRTLLILD